MSNNGFIRAEVDTSTAMRQLALSLEWIEEPNCMCAVGEIMRDYFNKFVPMSKGGGTLRKSADVSQSTWKKSVVVWTAPYAHYQYTGIVYENNIPTFVGNKHSGWASPKKTKKHPADDGRLMGENTGTFTMEYGPNKGKTFEIKGYSTPNTGADWINVGRYKHKAEYADIRRKIIRALKRHYEAKRVAYYG